MNKPVELEEPMIVQFTPEGVGVMAAMFFTEGWITEEQYRAVFDLLETWDWNNPACQKAFADTQPVAGLILEASTAQRNALIENLGRPLTEEEFESLDIPKGPLYAQNQTTLKD
jgi:hypothetical protein